ncbi:hypothetical protein [Vibrio phage Va2]|nr:hypothetical protein [Vibrio phage Va2]
MKLALKIISPSDGEEMIYPMGGQGYRLQKINKDPGQNNDVSLLLKNYLEAWRKGAPSHAETENAMTAIYKALEDMKVPLLYLKYIPYNLELQAEKISKYRNDNNEVPEHFTDPGHSGVYAYLYSDGVSIPLLNNFQYFVVNEVGDTFAKI